MATQEKTWNVANRLHSQKDSDNPEVNHIIAGADEIYDDEKGAKQSYINAQTEAALADRYTKAQVDSALKAKQDVLTFDNTPTAGSTNPVTSGGVKAAIDAVDVSSQIAVETERATNAETALGGRIDDVEDALETKADASDVEASLATKQDTIADLATIRSGAALGATAKQPATTLAGYGITDAYTKAEVNNLVSTPHQQYVTVATKADLDAITIGSADTIYRVSNYDGTQVDATKYAEYAWDGTQYMLLSVKSAVGEVFDVSEYNSGAPYKTLAAALAAVPESVQRGGMSIKFVQSSDNKYVQYRLTADAWSVDTENWAIADEGVYVENPEFVYVKTDNEGKILWAIRTDGGIYYGAGCPQQVKDYIEDKLAGFSPDEYEDIIAFLSDYLGSDTTLKVIIDGINAAKLDKEGLDPDALYSQSTTTSPEYLQVTTGFEGKILEGIKTDGTKVIAADLEVGKDTTLNGNAKIGGNTTILGDATILGKVDIQGATYTLQENSEWIEVLTDAKDRIIAGVREDGSVSFPGGIEGEISKEYVNEKIEDLQNELKDKCGIYCYPFRMLSNKSIYIYKDSLCSGFRPKYTYELYLNKPYYAVDYSPNAFRIKISEPGNNYVLNFGVKNKNNNIVVEKSVGFTVRNAPSVKLANKEVLNVFWLGDSLIGQNKNAIGAEWKRMLATSDSETHVAADKSIQLPTLNLCPNKLNLIGEDEYNSFAPYQYVQRIHQLLVGKRSSDWGGEFDFHTDNPFYNPFSSEPDEIGEDGFNKRVDFAWYFNHAIGEGKYPDLIYLCIGVNDLGMAYNWDFSCVELVVNDVVAFCKKVKSACDAIAGGNSGLKIKIYNHQTYTLFNSVYYYPAARQRLIYQKYYDAVYEAIQNPENNINSYVELIDCGSKFDWRVGYTSEDKACNNRYDGIQDIFYSDTLHMNLVGAYNYADCLIDDFIADEYFD